MQTSSIVGIVFLVLSLIYFLLALREGMKPEGTGSPARRAWMRVALIFACVGAALLAATRYFNK